jgi:tetratricopeptide (TPR) repeat protein
MTTSNLLEQGIRAAQAGHREEARALLIKVVEADERNEQAWLWLAGVVDNPDDMRTCLENVLDLNPSNAKAQQGLAWIEKRHGPRATTAPPKAESHAAPPAPDSQPQPTLGTAYTGPTTRLTKSASVPIGDAPTAPPASPSQIGLPGQPVVTQGVLDDYPCPYCGAPTTLDQHSCPKCRNNLTIRAAPRDKRSVPLTILGGLWMLNGVLSILGSLASLVLGLLAYSAAQTLLHRTNPKANMPFPTSLLIWLVFGLIISFITFRIGRGLLRRERWAYIVVLVLSVLGALSAVLLFLLGGALFSSLAAVPSRPGASPNTPDARSIALAGGTVLFIGLAVQAVYLLLVGMSYRDFFGPIVRFQPTLESGDHMEHYNSGVAYKNRGMWHMAAQEWEAANKMKPRDSSYLHALGLAYGQLKQFDQARATLDAALKVAPDNQQIRESRALIEQLAAKK